MNEELKKISDNIKFTQSRISCLNKCILYSIADYVSNGGVVNVWSDDKSNQIIKVEPDYNSFKFINKQGKSIWISYFDLFFYFIDGSIEIPNKDNLIFE